MKILGILLALTAAPAGPPTSVPAQDPAPAETPDGQEEPPEPPPPSPEAAAAWQAVVAATSTPGERAPIQAFELRAEVIARQGVQSNELENVTYRYLAPHYIRFGIGRERETGRGPGKGQGAYWLKDGDRVTKLEGRDYQQDRDLVRRMTTIAQNVIALSDPAKLAVHDLTLRAAAPEFLPESLAFHARRMTWLEFLSPDFDLYRDQPPVQLTLPLDGDLAAPAQRLFRVMIGADRKTHQPKLVVLREEGQPGVVTGEPLLFEFKSYREVNGYLLPHTILVRGYEPGVLPAVFQESPAQTIGVVTANLAPGFVPEDFLPVREDEEPKR